jgi:hypothetical protein
MSKNNLLFSNQDNVFTKPPTSTSTSDRKRNDTITDSKNDAEPVQIAVAAEPKLQTYQQTSLNSNSRDDTAQPKVCPKNFLAAEVGTVSLPELNTVRLKPIRQKTRHGVISILENREILVDFVSEGDIVIISSTGAEVCVCVEVNE